MHVLVIGSGVAGLCCALELAKAGASVEIIDRGPRLGATGCSWFAGGMLAPFCEGESAERMVTELGVEAIAWWREHSPHVLQRGSLVLAQPRDRAELDRFARRSFGHELLPASALAVLEPDLEGRFQRALYYREEAHVDPRLAMADLQLRLQELGIEIQFDTALEDYQGHADRRIDCRGLAARDVLPDLRGVKGEMLLIRSEEVELQRPVRLLHPRIPLYIVPREQGLFMVGATMIESDDRKRISARSMIELLQGAYAVHPAFAAAEIVEIGTEVRPAFSDNLPAMRQLGDTLYVNGFYRHGYLLAPAMARQARDLVLATSQSTELHHADSMQRPTGLNSLHNP